MEKKEDSHGGRIGRELSISIGLMGLYTSLYEGADRFKADIYPIINIGWRDRFFLNSYQGLGFYVWNRKNFMLGCAINYSAGRKKDDGSDFSLRLYQENSNRLDGLEDIGSGAVANILLEWKMENLFFNTKFEERVIGDHTGFQFFFDLGYRFKLTPRTILKPSFNTVYASSDYMDVYFGISKGRAFQSGLAEHYVGAGIKSIGAEMMVQHTLDRHWMIQVIGNYRSLMGGVADSPVVDDAGQYLLGAGLIYRF